MKKKVLKPLSVLVLFFWTTILFNGCIAKYDPIALQYATDLKTESMLMMDKAVEAYTEHEDEIGALLLKVEQAFEYARNKPRNTISAKQWKIMRDPGRNLLVGFMERWRKKNSLSVAFIAEAKKQVADAFDTIVDLEKGKRHELQD